MTSGNNNIAGVNDTADKLLASVNDTADKLFTGVNNTADEFSLTKNCIDDRGL
jgi:hypothetical protein